MELIELLERTKKEIIEKINQLENELKDDLKVNKDWFVLLPTPKKYEEMKEKYWELIKLYGMLIAIDNVLRELNKNGVN